MMNWLLDRGAPGPLIPGDVVVWRVPGIADAERSAALQALLSSYERERAARAATARRRIEYTVTRGTLRRILGRHLGLAPGALHFEYGRHGKPRLPGVALHFSVSHGGDGALIAVADGPVGVDLERVRERARLERIIARWFSPATREAVLTLPEAERLHAFHAAWTQREAYVKAVGGGLLVTPDRLPFVHPGAAAELVSEHGGGRTWTVVPLHPWPGYAAAAVASGAADHIRLFDAAALDE